MAFRRSTRVRSAPLGHEPTSEAPYEIELVGHRLVQVLALSRFFAAAAFFILPILVAFKSAPSKLAPVTSASVRSAAASSLFLKLALVRSAPRSEANSIITRAMFAPLNDEPSSLALLNAPRMRPIDWFFSSADRSAPSNFAFVILAFVKSAATCAFERSTPSNFPPPNWEDNRLAPLRFAPEKSELSPQAWSRTTPSEIGAPKVLLLMRER